MAGAGKVGVAYRHYFPVQDGVGDPATGISADDFTVKVRNPANDASDTPAVVESGESGLYYFEIAASFSTTHGAGTYGLMYSVNSVLPTVRATEGANVDLAVSDIDTMQVAIDRNADLIESQRGHHTWQGDWWYVDPTNGNDSNAGTRALPFATVGAAHTAAADSNHDVIFLVAGGSGITELDEQLTITKRYLLIRGPGNDFRWKSTSTGDVIQVTADGVELSGFRVQTHTTGSGRGIDVDGATFFHAHNVWIERSRGDGMRLVNCTNCLISDNLLEDVGTTGVGDGIAVNGTAGGGSHNHILRNRVYDTQGDGISVKGATSDHTVVERNHVQGATGWGIQVTSDATRTEIDSNHLGDNALGPIQDTGIDTVQTNNEQWAKESDGKLEEVHQLHGLVTASPLVNDRDAETRTTGTIAQDVTVLGNVVTVTRTA